MSKAALTCDVHCPPSPGPLDIDNLLKRLDGDIELLLEVLDIFPVDCERMLNELRDAVSEKDTLRLERAAHTLRGSLGNLSAVAAATAAGQLEELCRGGNLAALDELQNRVSNQTQASIVAST